MDSRWTYPRLDFIENGIKTKELATGFVNSRLVMLQVLKKPEVLKSTKDLTYYVEYWEMPRILHS